MFRFIRVIRNIRYIRLSFTRCLFQSGIVREVRVQLFTPRTKTAGHWPAVRLLPNNFNVLCGGVFGAVDFGIGLF